MSIENIFERAANIEKTRTEAVRYIRDIAKEIDGLELKEYGTQHRAVESFEIGASNMIHVNADHIYITSTNSILMRGLLNSTEIQSEKTLDRKKPFYAERHKDGISFHIDHYEAGLGLFFSTYVAYKHPEQARNYNQSKNALR